MASPARPSYCTKPRYRRIEPELSAKSHPAAAPDFPKLTGKRKGNQSSETIQPDQLPISTTGRGIARPFDQLPHYLRVTFPTPRIITTTSTRLKETLRRQSQPHAPIDNIITRNHETHSIREAHLHSMTIRIHSFHNSRATRYHFHILTFIKSRHLRPLINKYGLIANCRPSGETRKSGETSLQLASISRETALPGG